MKTNPTDSTNPNSDKSKQIFGCTHFNETCRYNVIRKIMNVRIAIYALHLTSFEHAWHSVYTAVTEREWKYMAKN